MTNEVKIVKDVFKDFQSRSRILNCEITNVSIFKKSNKLTIDLKSSQKIVIGEKLEFEYYLKSRFKVNEVQINIEESIVKKEKTTKGDL